MIIRSSLEISCQCWLLFFFFCKCVLHKRSTHSLHNNSKKKKDKKGVYLSNGLQLSTFGRLRYKEKVVHWTCPPLLFFVSCPSIHLMMLRDAIHALIPEHFTFHMKGPVSSVFGLLLQIWCKKNEKEYVLTVCTSMRGWGFWSRVRDKSIIDKP